MARGLLQALLLSSLLWPGLECCFQTLRTSPYETYWLPNQNSRFTGTLCLALRGFRWTLKFIKVTYEHWQLEMNYAKCITDKLGMNTPFILMPPWNRFRARGLQYSGIPAIPEKFPSPPTPKMLRNPSIATVHRGRQNLPDKQSLELSAYSQHRSWRVRNKSPFIISLPEDHSHQKSKQSALTPRQDTIPADIISLLQTWFNIVYTFWSVLSSLATNAWNGGIIYCTRSYMKQAFWRWVDGAPFL